MKQNIVEITKGKTGTGLLLENDGYVSLELPGNKKLYESIKLNEATGQRNLPEKLIFDTVFQKFDTPNANGRIYPEAILKREVEKYQQAIKERRAYGECYTPDVLCLTKNGWKELRDVKVGDEVITLNPETQEIEVLPVINKIERQHDGKMIRIKGRNIDDLVTPGHKFPVYNSENIFVKFYTAEELLNNTSTDEYYIPEMCFKNITSDKISLTNEDIEIFEEDYNGEVMCIDLPKNHIWYVMSNGNSHWTGNCNHPESSTIDLSRIGMNIIELHWEGKTLVGKIEIPITDGYRNLGIVSTCADEVAHWILSGLKVGVSSRGLGSVEQKNGYLVVSQDFELVTWDLVSQPSTRNSWVCTQDGEIELYKESKENLDFSEKNTILSENNDKYSKFEAWLND